MIAVHLDVYQMANDEPIFIGVFSSYDSAIRAAKDILTALHIEPESVTEHIIDFCIHTKQGRTIRFLTQHVELDVPC